MRTAEGEAYPSLPRYCLDKRAMAGLIYASSGLEFVGGEVGTREPRGSAVRMPQVQDGDGDGYGYGIYGGDGVFE